jgi:hypothetical protein
MTFDQKANTLVREYFEFLKTEEYKIPKTVHYHINYDVRQAIAGVEIDMRDRLQKLQAKNGVIPKLKIQDSDIIHYALRNFLNQEHNIEDLVEDFIAVNTHRSNIKTMPSYSRMAKDVHERVLITVECIQTRFIARGINSRKISLKSFVEYVLTKFIHQYYV